MICNLCVFLYQILNVIISSESSLTENSYHTMCLIYCSSHQAAGDDKPYDQAKRLSDHYNRDKWIMFGAQLLSFRACFRAEIAQQSAVSQFAKMLIMDYHSVCTALLLFLRVATAERPFSKLKLIKTYLRRRRGWMVWLSCPLKKQIMHHHFYVWKASFGSVSLSVLTFRFCA